MVLRFEASVDARTVLPEPGMPATAMRSLRELSVCWNFAVRLWMLFVGSLVEAHLPQIFLTRLSTCSSIFKGDP
jgi:hypothetical protein